jgi:hypothetical protein
MVDTLTSTGRQNANQHETEGCNEHLPEKKKPTCLFAFPTLTSGSILGCLAKDDSHQTTNLVESLAGHSIRISTPFYPPSVYLSATLSKMASQSESSESPPLMNYIWSPEGSPTDSGMESSGVWLWRV